MVKKAEIPKNDILTVISEPGLVNRGVAGGKCADETDLKGLDLWIYDRISRSLFMVLI